MMKIVKGILIILSIIGLFFSLSVNGATVKKSDGKCYVASAVKNLSYSSFYSDWFTRKAASFCSSGSADYRSLSCSSGTKKKCSYRCNGVGGGKSTGCYFYLNDENLCGESNGADFSAVPAKGLCVSGASASMVDDRKSSWVWSCKKYSGLLVTYCSAKKSCFKSGEFLSGSQECCSGLLSCPTANPGVNYCSEKCSTCGTEYEPVCGKDGRDYNNECMARRAGTEVSFEGECKYKGVKCGAASESIAYSLSDPANLCKYGTPSVVSGSGPWTWMCQSDEGEISFCSASKMNVVDGVCGASDGKVMRLAPNGDLCKYGVASSVKGDIVWSWTCSLGGGRISYCHATREGYNVDGKCGSPSRDLSGYVTRDNLCVDGLPSSVLLKGDKWSWTCGGLGSGKDAECSVSFVFNSFPQARTPGVCGSNNGKTLGEEPIKDLCSSGKVKSFSYKAETGKWEWTCSGVAGGGDSNCYAYYSSAMSRADGKCGMANDIATKLIPVVDLCEKGTPSSVTGTGPWYWTCKGIGGGKDVKCSAKKPSPKNGACGSSSTNRNGYVSAPTTDLCVSGSASSITGTGPWYWTCFGVDGGKDVQCSAKLSGTLAPRSETKEYMFLDLWINEKKRKGIRISVKDYGVSVYMGKSSPYKTGVGPDNPGDYILAKVTPADGWIDAYFYELPEDNKLSSFCFDAWYKINWNNGKLSSDSQFYSDCIQLKFPDHKQPEITIKQYPVLQGAIVLSLWKDGEESKGFPGNYSTIIVRNNGLIPITPDKELTLADSVIGDCITRTDCPKYDLVLGNNNKRIAAYLTKGSYCYSSWTRYCNGYYCSNSKYTDYWCFEVK